MTVPAAGTAAPSQSDTAAQHADVCVIGAGLVGLYNALQYARRGMSVVLVDELTDKHLANYKVGESLLVFANAFLRTVGELDDTLSSSFVKQGFWMAYGLEGKESFDEDASEWGFLARLPDRWREAVRDQRLVRAMAGDVQIVRPDVEAVLRDKVSRTPGVTFVNTGLAREVELGDGDAAHLVRWRSRDGVRTGEIAARWIVDCSGRARLLARLFGHDIPLDDGFRTAAAWGQFSGCTDDLFDERWEYRFPEGQTIRRDLDTVHLWGDGYWIWLIRLTEGRISVGITVDHDRFPDTANLRDLFWTLVRRYPLLDFLSPDNLLQFHAYRDVQYLSDTYVSARRYALAGDSASIIDAFYSQGLSLSLSTSWHTANIAQRDIAEGVLDEAYIDRVNRATLADWRLMRSMVRSKYSEAIADSRFFLLDHLLDYLVLSAALLPRYRIARWLVETDAQPGREGPAQARLRRNLSRTLYLTQCQPWHVLDPARVARIAERWHRGLERRARWRLAHGIRVRPMKAALRADAAIPLIWRLPFLRLRRRAELTPRVLKEPAFMRVKGTEANPPLLLSAGMVMLAVNLICLAYDVVDTGLRRVVHRIRRPFRGRRRPARRAPAAGGNDARRPEPSRAPADALAD